jgi:fermentation-respiration switch protein FrsA (DUF1100 family)
MSVRRDVAFDAGGTTLRGWLFLPEGVRTPVPTIVMAHGYSAVKEMYLDRYAEAFAASGLGALVFDHRNFGASDGTPRQEIDPVAQMRDYRHAVSYARTLPGVDRGRIGVWGTSYSGGHALVVGALDRRVSCVVAQVPSVSGHQAALRRTRPDQVASALARLDAEREARFAGAAPTLIPVVAPEPGRPCAIPGRDAWEFFTGAGAPAWRNEVTLLSADLGRGWEPGSHVAQISPTPLLMIVAANDTLTLTDLELEAYSRALEPRKLVLLPGGHFEAYTTYFTESSGAARDWFVEHLGGDVR